MFVQPVVNNGIKREQWQYHTGCYWKTPATTPHANNGIIVIMAPYQKNIPQAALKIVSL